MAIDFSTPPASRITINPAPEAKKPERAEQPVASKDSFWGEDGFGFDDLIDMVNPLQHIPIVSTIYRELTGDEIAPGPRMVGGAVVGGVVGFVASAANVIFEQETGKDIGESMVAAVFGEDDAPQAAQMAQAPRPVNEPMELIGAQPLPATLPPPDDALEPLDFSNVTLPATLPGNGSDEEDEISDTLLQLFSNRLHDAADDYRSASMMDYLHEVAEEMKA